LFVCSKHGYLEVCVEKFNEKQSASIKRMKSEGEMPYPDISSRNK